MHALKQSKEMPTKWYGVNFSSSGLIFVLRPYTLTECWSRVVAVSFPNPVFLIQCSSVIAQSCVSIQWSVSGFSWLIECTYAKGETNALLSWYSSCIWQGYGWPTHTYTKFLQSFLNIDRVSNSLPKSGRVNRVLTELTWVFPIPVKGEFLNWLLSFIE